MSFKFVQLVVGVILIALAIILLVGCGTVWHARYNSPEYGDAVVDVVIPEKSEGFSK